MNKKLKESESDSKENWYCLVIRNQEYLKTSKNSYWPESTWQYIFFLPWIEVVFCLLQICSENWVNASSPSLIWWSKCFACTAFIPPIVGEIIMHNFCNLGFLCLSLEGVSWKQEIFTRLSVLWTIYIPSSDLGAYLNSGCLN